MHSSLKPGNLNRGKLLSGFMITMAWLPTLLLEKPRGHHIFDGDDMSPDSLGDSIRDNPRGLVARPLAMGNNLASLWGANNERIRYHQEVLDAQRQIGIADNSATRTHLAYTQNKQNDYKYNVFSACSFLIAHALFGLSGNKRPHSTKDDDSMMRDMVLLSANMLARQPENIRQAAIAETADYVSKLAHVTFDKKQVEDAIRAKMESLSQSTWAGRVQPQQETGLQARI